MAAKLVGDCWIFLIDHIIIVMFEFKFVVHVWDKFQIDNAV